MAWSHKPQQTTGNSADMACIVFSSDHAHEPNSKIHKAGSEVKNGMPCRAQSGAKAVSKIPFKIRRNEMSGALTCVKMHVHWMIMSFWY